MDEQVGIQLEEWQNALTKVGRENIGERGLVGINAMNILGSKASSIMEELVGIQPQLEELEMLMDLDNSDDAIRVINLVGRELLDFDDNWMSSTEGDEEVLSNQDLPLSQEIGKQLLACGISKEHTKSIEADEYPTAKCIVALDEIDGISDNSYVKALEKFKDPYWREAFLTMSHKGKKAWLNSLV
ncbi:Myb/SANT-like DNA-binding domain protein [Senna tora]|uniref:Myb/SANT-like DNA-binding domain protein n=1 Tax=Senna tora TaxID=362788 RepID=A0A835CIJ1_9FABA|nr:Myb/SANT-like DNA-binding domain protein [Senna tora]